MNKAPPQAPPAAGVTARAGGAQMFFDDLPIWGFIGKVEKLLRPGEKPELRFYLFTRDRGARRARRPRGRVLSKCRGAAHRISRHRSCQPARGFRPRTPKACCAACAAGPAHGARAPLASAGGGSGAKRPSEDGVVGSSM